MHSQVNQIWIVVQPLPKPAGGGVYYNSPFICFCVFVIFFVFLLKCTSCFICVYRAYTLSCVFFCLFVFFKSVTLSFFFICCNRCDKVSSEHRWQNGSALFRSSSSNRSCFRKGRSFPHVPSAEARERRACRDAWSWFQGQNAHESAKAAHSYV